MTRINISQAKPEDAAELTAIAFAAKRHWGYPEEWIAEWAGQLTITPEFVSEHPTFVAREAGEMLGMAAIETDDLLREATIVHLWVKPQAMGRRVGAALFVACEQAARLSRATRLKVESDPNAEGFYRKMGAIPVGSLAANVRGMERWLPVLAKTLDGTMPLRVQS